MKIGVVCEGQTDFIAIRVFLKAEFAAKGKDLEFYMIQPAFDNTLPSGWSQVLLWLENNERAFRSGLYLKSDAIFAIENSEEKYDALLFQIDSDVIGECGFENFIAKRGFTYHSAGTNLERGQVILRLLLKMAGHASDADALSSREVMSPIVESSEAWVVAAEHQHDDAETLIGQSLVDAFGALNDRVSGKASRSRYIRINKKTARRREICEFLAKSSTPAGRSFHYDEVVKKIASL